MLKIATPEIQAALDAYLAASEEEDRAMRIKLELQTKFRIIASMTEGRLVLATWKGRPVVVQQSRSGLISLEETEERDG